MSYGDPDFLECICSHRALRDEEAVIYVVPVEGQGFKQYRFAKDCPVHGYTVNPASTDAENT